MKKVPRTIIISGDQEKGVSLIGFADAQLKILENEMRFQRLKQGHRTVRVDQQSVVECWSCFALQQVTIHVDPAGGKPKKKREWQCFCNQCLSVGRVLRINNGVAGQAEETFCGFAWEIYPERYYCTEEITYDVELCVNGNLYILAMNSMPTDHTPHCPGDIVLCHVHQVDTLVDTTAYDLCYDTRGSCSFGQCPTGNEVALFYRILPFSVPESIFSMVA